MTKKKSPPETSDFKCGVIFACGLITDCAGELPSVKEALSACGLDSEQDCIDAGAEEYDYEKLKVYWGQDD